MGCLGGSAIEHDCFAEALYVFSFFSGLAGEHANIQKASRAVFLSLGHESESAVRKSSEEGFRQNNLRIY